MSEEKLGDYEMAGEVLQLVRTGDKQRAAARLGNLLATLVSEIPLVGKVTEEGLQALADQTSLGKMRKAVAAADKHDTELDKARSIAAFAVELIEEHLHGLSEDQQAVAAALVRLDERLAEWDQRLDVDRLSIEHLAGGIGARLKGRDRKATHTSIKLMTGGTGVESSSEG